MSFIALLLVTLVWPRFYTFISKAALKDLCLNQILHKTREFSKTIPNINIADTLEETFVYCLYKIVYKNIFLNKT